MPGFHIWNAWERVLEVATLIVSGTAPRSLPTNPPLACVQGPPTRYYEGNH